MSEKTNQKQLTAEQVQAMHRMELFKRHAETTVNLYGPADALLYAMQICETVGTLRRPDGNPLPPEMARIRDAGIGGAMAIDKVMDQRVVQATPSIILPGQ
jgi:hypothetical protein